MLSTMGLVLNVTVTQLISSHTVWIDYLRGVDVNTTDLSEFQYLFSVLHLVVSGVIHIGTGCDLNHNDLAWV
jgi:hypothetical protein